MRKIEIVVDGEAEDKITQEILQGICSVVQNNMLVDVSLKVKNDLSAKEIDVPSFLKLYSTRADGAKSAAGGR